MRLKTFLTSVSAAGLLIAASVTTSALADSSHPTLLAKKDGAGNPFGGGGGGGSDPVDPQPSGSWMHDDVPLAWGYDGNSYKGFGVTITFVDDFGAESPKRAGNLGDGDYSLTHGGWTSKEGGLIAPDAAIVEREYTLGLDGKDYWEKVVTLDSGAFNVLNLSYADTYYISQKTTDDYTKGILFTPQETSIIDFAKSGAAVVVKSAGNDGGTAVGDSVTSGRGRFTQTVRDYLSVGLMDAAGDNPNTFSGVWVGALDGNSSVTHNPDGTSTVQTKVSIADYSTQAGTDERVNANYLMVGVDTALNGGFEGTSFAAPIVSGYAAILASKFTNWTPLQVKNQLLDTARIDTINDYSLTVHGQGEASIYRAVAPICIETCSSLN